MAIPNPKKKNPLAGVPEAGLAPAPMRPSSQVLPPQRTVGPGNMLTAGGDTYDMPEAKPEGKVDFRSFLLPVKNQPENSARQSIPGEARGTAQRDGSSAAFNDISGANTLDDISGVADQVSDLWGKQIPHAEQMAVDASKKPLSTGRKIAGTLAGVGMGLATMNPLAGINFGQSIAQGGRNREIQQATAQADILKEKATGLEKAGGLYSQRAQREGELGQSAGRQAEAKNAADKQAYEQANPEQQVISTGSGQTYIGPKRATSPQAAVFASQPIGEPKPVGTHTSQIKVDAQGKAHVMITMEDGTLKDEVVEGFKGSPEEGTNLQIMFEKFKQANPNATPQQLYEAGIRIISAGAIQAGANQSADDARRQADNQKEQELLSHLNMEYQDRVSRNPALLYDPALELAEKNKMLDEIASDPEYGRFVQHVRETYFKTPRKLTREEEDRKYEYEKTHPKQKP